MSKRVNRALSALLAVSMALTAMPFGRIVNADENITEETSEIIEDEAPEDEAPEEESEEEEPADEVSEEPSEEAVEEISEEEIPEETEEIAEDIELNTYDLTPVVSYTEYGWDDTNKTLTTTSRTIDTYTVVTSNLIKESSGGTGDGLLSGTYFVNSDVTIDDYVYIRKNQTVNLIVRGGVTLTCTKGIGCGYNKSNEYATLNIYGTGTIVTTGRENCAGIGGKDDETNGYITIHGTTIVATGGKHAAGIGGGEGGKDPNASSPTITIYAGDITATGGIDGAGIGGGDEQPGAITYIYGGTINASSKKHGAGIGGGDEEGTLGINIYGGKITATGGEHGAGIGAGEEGGSLHTIHIYGGEITATGGSGAAGMGGGYDEDTSGNIIIEGTSTKLYVYGGSKAAGIGAGYNEFLRKGDMGNDLTINCGAESDIKIYAGDYNKISVWGGAGIGGGLSGNLDATVYIYGGNIEIFSALGGAGIGGGCEENYIGGEGGDVYIGGGNITIHISCDDIVNYLYNEAIGAGNCDHVTGSVYIHHNNNRTGRYMRVCYRSAQNAAATRETSLAGDRSHNCHGVYDLWIEECPHTDHNGNSGLSYTINNDGTHTVKCKYCGYEETVAHQDRNCPCGYTNPTHLVELITDAGRAVFEIAHGNNFDLPYDVEDVIADNSIPTRYYAVKGWLDQNDYPYGPGLSVEITADMTFTMWREQVYRIECEAAQHGRITSDVEYVDIADNVTLDVEPENGYRVGTVSYRYITGFDSDMNLTYSAPVEITPVDGVYQFMFPHLQDPANGVIVTATFIEDTPTVDPTVINGVNVSLGGELGLNFHVSVPSDVVQAGAKAVLNGPAGEQEYVLSSLTPENDVYKLTYNLKAIYMDHDVSLQILDSSNNPIDLFIKSGDRLIRVDDNTMETSIYDYAAAAKEDTSLSEAEQAMVDAMYTYGAYSIKWKYGVNVPEDANELVATLNKADFEKYKLDEDVSFGDITLAGISLLLDSNTALKLYFTCSSDVTDHTVKVDGKTLDIHPTGTTDLYYVTIGGIAAHQLTADIPVVFDGRYTVTVSPMTYVYYSIEGGSVTDDVMNVLKAICSYSDAAKELKS